MLDSKKVKEKKDVLNEKRLRVDLLTILKTDFSLITILVSLIWICLYMFIPIDFAFKIPFNFFLFQDWEASGPTSHGLGVMLIFMLLINPIAKKLGKKPLGPDQLIFANIMVIIGILTTYAGFFLSWIGLMVGPAYLRMTDPTKYDPYLSNISPLVAPKSQEAIMALYNGGSSVPWGEWIPPFISWGLFMGVLFFVMLCMGVLVRRKWTEHEHLNYPIASMTLSFMGDIGATEDAPEGGSIWKNNIMWIGFAFAFIWYASHHLNRYFPAFPMFHEDALNRIKMGSLREQPLIYTAMGGNVATVRFRPSFLGLLWFAQVDLLFSIWFFNLLQTILNMFFINRGTFGFVLGGHSAIVNRQWNSIMFGSMFGMGILYLWAAREDIKLIFRAAFSKGESKLDDSEEPMSYKTAVIGGILGLIFLFAFSVFLLKVKFIWALIIIAFILCWTLALARIRAESGIGWAIGAGNQRFSSSFLVPFFGTKTLGASGLVDGAFLSEWARDWQVNFLSHTMEGYKMADVVGARRKSINVAAFMGYIMGLAMCLFVLLPMFYSRGASLGWQRFRSYGYNEFELGVNWLSGVPKPTDPASIFFSLFSVGFIVFLGVMRSTFVWWPFHPIGYFFGAGYLSGWLVEQAFVIWLIKTLIVRWGGESLRRKLTPAFTGMIYGTMVVCLIAPIVRYIVALFGY
jgi:hypothetical protein